ncbi:hypothetical protein JOC54_002933 [Alkalihalobacillus xiaoxiensis]|uniref:DUF4230 domain-containing protein n=1 Tax=Shouchella xiaoxiensis TaxID=766895 RepID=A0ABS2SVW8_9BACI|nr:hypothetical protein [Shouchella xiaoxiensis]MBM7839653.1 hypothetical protein [Shouchella xiaoxiensis]
MDGFLWTLVIGFFVVIFYRFAVHPFLRRKYFVRRVEKRLVVNDEYKDVLIASFKAIQKELKHAGSGVDELKRTYNLMGTRTKLEVDQKNITLWYEENGETLIFMKQEWYLQADNQSSQALPIPFSHHDADYWHRAGEILRMLPLWCQAANTHYFLSEEEAVVKREQIEGSLFREIDLFIRDLSSRYEASPLLNVSG